MSLKSEQSSGTDIALVKVRKTAEHALALYELLSSREHNISHTSLPSFEEHQRFVFSHPYRAWYLIRSNGLFVGSIYLLSSNYIGISTSTDSEQCVVPALNSLMARYRPLPAIKSIRASVFAINVAPTNVNLCKTLEEMGGELAQKTYVLR